MSPHEDWWRESIESALLSTQDEVDCLGLPACTPRNKGGPIQSVTIPAFAWQVTYGLWQGLPDSEQGDIKSRGNDT